MKNDENVEKKKRDGLVWAMVVSRREEKDWINILFFYAAGWSGGDEGIALMWVG